MNALILIDLQFDFFNEGALPVPEAEQVLPVANRAMDHFGLIVASQDWHPANHGSFAANHWWRKPGQVIDLNGLPQVLWPIHCVQETFGASFHSGLDTSRIDRVFRKGTDPGIDSYSCFFDNGHRKSTGMGDWLKDQQVTDLYFLGLATDYCVKSSVLDALDLGFNAWLIEDGCRGVNLNPGDAENAVAEMEKKGARIIRSGDLPPA